MFNVKKVAKKVLGRDKIKSTTRNYWENSAKSSTKKAIKRICDGYDEKDFESHTKPFFFHDENTLNSNMKVLDLACGMGRTCKWVAPQVKKYVGVDFIPKMIEKAKEYNKEISNAEFHVNDGQSIKIFDDESFDVVYAELAFQHMEKPIQNSYVPEVFRVLKNGGSFYGQIPKISYYHDESFALTKSELDELFKNFLVTFIDSSAYYIVQAKKT